MNKRGEKPESLQTGGQQTAEGPIDLLAGDSITRFDKAKKKKKKKQHASAQQTGNNQPAGDNAGTMAETAPKNAPQQAGVPKNNAQPEGAPRKHEGNNGSRKPKKKHKPADHGNEQSQHEAKEA